ncbi:MAG: BamA/TamA family outer membrane protein, partial [Alphaproteobacteria bacterium]|nr:BamA/TamA family outer membrane protein [Alphaproteobacteria bacterium]
TLDPSTYYLPDANGVPQCSVLLAGRYLCDAIGHRTISDFGYSLVRSTLDNALHPGHGMRLVISQDLAGPGGNVRYIKSTFDGAKYFTLHKGFIFSAKLEGGAIIPLKGGPAGQDPVQLSDRFFLGEPNFAGFDIQGVGPKVLRNYLGVSPATAAQFVGDAYELYDGQKTPLSVLAGASQQGQPTYTLPTDPNNPTPYSYTTYDSLGGRYYYKGRFELEIPLGSGAKELGLRPSIFVDYGSVWGVQTPQTITIPATAAGTNYFAYQDANGTLKYYPFYAPLGRTNSGLQIFQVPVTAATTFQGASVAGATTTCATGYSLNQVAANDPSCTGAGVAGAIANLKNRPVPPFTEQYTGNTPFPRLSVGFGVNWNSPFGPFRIDVAAAVLKQYGDQLKTVTFNVGTQF